MGKKPSFVSSRRQRQPGRMSACTALANCPGPGHLLNITAFDGLQGGVEDFNEDLLASVCSGLVCGGRGIGLLVGHQLLCLEPYCQKVVSMVISQCCSCLRDHLGRYDHA